MALVAFRVAFQIREIPASLLKSSMVASCTGKYMEEGSRGCDMEKPGSDGFRFFGMNFGFFF